MAVTVVIVVDLPCDRGGGQGNGVLIGDGDYTIDAAYRSRRGRVNRCPAGRGAFGHGVDPLGRHREGQHIAIVDLCIRNIAAGAVDSDGEWPIARAADRLGHGQHVGRLSRERGQPVGGRHRRRHVALDRNRRWLDLRVDPGVAAGCSRQGQRIFAKATDRACSQITGCNRRTVGVQAEGGRVAADAGATHHHVKSATDGGIATIGGGNGFADAKAAWIGNWGRIGICKCTDNGLTSVQIDDHLTASKGNGRTAVAVAATGQVGQRPVRRQCIFTDRIGAGILGKSSAAIAGVAHGGNTHRIQLAISAGEGKGAIGPDRVLHDLDRAGGRPKAKVVGVVVVARQRQISIRNGIAGIALPAGDSAV